MTAMYDKAREFANLYPQHPASRSSGNWIGLCGIHMVQFGGFLGGATTHDIQTQPDVGITPWWLTSISKQHDTAKIAGDNSGWLNPDWKSAPIGAFHFFDVPGVPEGHVGIDTIGGGTHFFNASSYLGDKWTSGGLGVSSVTDYCKNKNATYRGWATNYAGGTIRLPKEVVVEPNQRQAGTAGAKTRDYKTTAGAEVKPGVLPNAVITPLGWVTGEKVTQNGVTTEVWLVVSEGLYSWAGGYTDITANNLVNLNMFKVAFDTKGGAPIPATQTVQAHKTATKPADPALAGKVFAGWFNGATAYDFSSQVLQDITLTAHWTDKPSGDGTLTPETIEAIANAVAETMQPMFDALEADIAKLGEKIDALPKTGTFSLTTEESKK